MNSNFYPSTFSGQNDNPMVNLLVNIPTVESMLSSSSNVPPMYITEPYSLAVFSQVNFDFLQQAIIDGVKQKSGRVIGMQDPAMLRIIITEQFDAFTPSKVSILQNVRYLDSIIVDLAVGMVNDNITEHVFGVSKYMVNPVNDLPLPIQANVVSQKPQLLGFINRYF